MSLTQEQMKQQVALRALEYIEDDMVVGVGTGSTIKYFIDGLATCRKQIKAIVSSSETTTRLLQQQGFTVEQLNNISCVDIYVDGADEATSYCQLIKGGGAALTREKIIATMAKFFVCIIDERKLVPYLGKFPLPVEVIPMARSYVARELVKLGGAPNWRQSVVTDNGNWLLDVHNLCIKDPIALERTLNNIAGVVTNGIFALRLADLLLVARSDGTIDVIKSK